jgi:DNA invertase Pin-like site-specific DNA recombinase
MKKVAIYVRVSTKDKGQDVENQVSQLKRFCSSRGWDIYEIYSDNESGQKGRRERKSFDRMFNAARLGEFDILLFWALDRFSREGTLKTISYLQLLDEYKIRFVSYTEEFLNTNNDLVQSILIPLLSYFAQLEAKKISERTKAGMERARKNGKRLGREALSSTGVDKKIIDLQQQGYTDTQIMKELKISRNTVKKYKQKEAA